MTLHLVPDPDPDASCGPDEHTYVIIWECQDCGMILHPEPSEEEN